MEMQPGTIVKFKNLVGKPEFNGRCGVVIKQLPNGRFNILNDASEVDLSFNEKNLQIISTCPNEHRLNTEGVLIWPHVKGVNTPSMQWMDDSSLTKAFENPFVETGAFKGCNQDIYTGCWADEDRERVMKKYEDILLEKLGWNSPQMWMMTITSKGKIENKVCIYYDEDSEAPVNDWMHTRFYWAFNRGQLPKIRGSFIYLNQLDDPKWAQGPILESINYHKSIFHNLRYFDPVPSFQDTDPIEHAKKYERYARRLGKIRAALPGCSNEKCRNCEHVSDGNFKAFLEYATDKNNGCTIAEAREAFDNAIEAKYHYDDKGIKAKDALNILQDMMEADDKDPSKTLTLVANKLEMTALIMIYKNHLQEVPVNQKGEDRKAKREQKRAKTLSKNKKKTNKK